MPCIIKSLIADIDHFRKINDTYGHQLGDRVLNKTAMIIKGNCRKSDIPARYGGEEFAVILPETSTEGAFVDSFIKKDTLSATISL
ncbi:MAG: diguanylate cyclase [Spirochaetales bacterium]|nr:diguanylate cyclase [Spirochaetales bacterium]